MTRDLEKRLRKAAALARTILDAVAACYRERMPARIPARHEFLIRDEETRLDVMRVEEAAAFFGEPIVLEVPWEGRPGYPRCEVPILIQNFGAFLRPRRGKPREGWAWYCPPAEPGAHWSLVARCAADGEVVPL